MKHLSLLALLFAIVYGLNAQGAGKLPGKTESFVWNGSGWIADHEHQTKYNNHSLIEQDVVYRLGVAAERLTCLYDDLDRMTRQTNQVKSGGLWQNSSQYLYSEFLDRNPAKVEYQEYIGGVWMTQWGTWSEFEFEGDGQDQRLKSEIRKVFWPSDGHWHQQSRITSEYGQGGLKSVCLTEEFDEQQGWKNSKRESFAWDREGLLDFILYDLWDGTGWVPGGRVHYRHSANGGLEITYYQWDPVAQIYTGYERDAREYDDHGNLILDTRETWKVTGWDLASGSRWTPTYTDGVLVELIREDWMTDPVAGQTGALAWYGVSRDLFSEFFTAGLADQKVIDYEVLVYPNPASDVVRIYSEKPFCEGDHVLLWDSGGRLLMSKKMDSVQQLLELEIKSRTTGICLIQIVSGRNVIYTYRLVLK